MVLYPLTVAWPNILVHFLLVASFLMTVNLQLLRLMLGRIRQNRTLRSAYVANLLILLLVNLLTIQRTQMMTLRAGSRAFTLNTPNVLLHCFSRWVVRSHFGCCMTIVADWK